MAAVNLAVPTVDREVLGFAPYWELPAHGGWRYDLLTTVAYFGLDVKGDGSFDTTTAGWSGWNSQDLVDAVNQAHQAGDRVVLVIKQFDEATINQIVTNPTATQAAVTNTINAVAGKLLDGVNVDFEGSSNPNYPNIQSGMTNFMTQLSGQVHARWPSAMVTVDTYTGSASWDGGIFKIGDLAPVVDAIFVMAYDMNASNMPGQAGPNAPLSGNFMYNDTLAVSQYLGKAPASKVILGVPYYGYKYTTGSTQLYASTSDAGVADTYAGIQGDFACALQLSQSWDGNSQTPWASWWSPASGDPCGGNHNSWRELYYDNSQSLGLKYDLVNANNLRGAGVWALGYDGGSADLWNALANHFACPFAASANVAAAATQNTTEFSVAVSATQTCPAQSFDVQQRDTSPGFSLDWADIAFAQAPTTVNGQTSGANVTAEGYRGHTYQFRAHTRQFNGVTDWSAPSSTVTVAAGASSPYPFAGIHTLDAYGVIHGDASPPLAASTTWPGWNIARSARIQPGTGGQAGLVLDGYGGLHLYGKNSTTTALTTTAYWAGWDIARDLDLMPDGGGGYVMDGYGGLHPFSVNGGQMPSPVPTVNYETYWPGWDIARKVVILPDGKGGYIMDGSGGLHPFPINGNAPPPGVPTVNYENYWPGWNIARSVVLLPDSTNTSVAGYILDGYGGLHPFAVNHALPPRIAPQQWVNYWSGWDITRGVILLTDSTAGAMAGYLLDGYGGVHAVAANRSLPPAIQQAAEINYWPGQDIAKAIVGP